MSNHGVKRILGGFEKSAIQSLAEKFADRLNFGACAYRTGLAVSAIEQLVCLDLLTELNEPAMQALYVLRFVAASSFDKLLIDICSAAQSLEGPTVSLVDALRCIGGREKPAGPIIKGMLDGNVAFAIDTSARKLVQQIRIRTCDIARAASFVFNVDAYPDFAFSKTMTRSDASIVLNVKPAIVVDALKDGMPELKADGTDLSRDAILGLADSRIASGEIRRRWLRKDSKLPQPLYQDPTLRPIDRFGRDRREIEQFFNG